MRRAITVVVQFSIMQKGLDVIHKLGTVEDQAWK